MDRLLQTAWQPLTPGGVAAFAGASLGRVLVVQFVFALLAAVAVTWCVHAAWFPTIEQAIQKLPEGGEIRSGQLRWPGPSPQLLAEGRFLSVVVDLEHGGELRGPADIQVEIGATSVRTFSLFGFVDVAYPPSGVVGFNHPAAGPWWGAWSPVILAGCFCGTVVWLLVAWWLLATVYCLPVWLIGFFSNRALTLRGSWRLAGAALMPGALLLALTVFCYGAGFLDPPRLLVVLGAHFVVGWLYLWLSLQRLPLVEAAAARGNPFAPDGGEQPAAAKPGDANPFGPHGR